MPGETDVINQALREVGATPITSRTDGSPSANTVDDVYDDIRDDLLRGHNWNFATKRVKLARVTNAPAFEFDHAYALPADWLRTVSVHNNNAGHGAVLHRMELIDTQRCIIASSDDIWLRYIAKITDPNLMATDFRRAFVYSLAEALAIPLASSNTLRQQMEEKARRKIGAARSADAQGAFPELRARGSWASSRGGRNTGYFSD